MISRLILSSRLVTTSEKTCNRFHLEPQSRQSSRPRSTVNRVTSPTATTPRTTPRPPSRQPENPPTPTILYSNSLRTCFTRAKPSLSDKIPNSPTLESNRSAQARTPSPSSPSAGKTFNRSRKPSKSATPRSSPYYPQSSRASKSRALNL